MSAIEREFLKKGGPIDFSIIDDSDHGPERSSHLRRLKERERVYRKREKERNKRALKYGINGKNKLPPVLEMLKDNQFDTADDIYDALQEVLKVQTMSRRTMRSKRKNTNKIKRPLNAFMVWSKIQRNYITTVYPTQRHHSDISMALGCGWKELSEEEKRPYYDIAKRLSDEHQMRYPDYKYQPKRRKPPMKILSADITRTELAPSFEAVSSRHPNGKKLTVSVQKSSVSLPHIISAPHYIQRTDSNGVTHIKLLVQRNPVSAFKVKRSSLNVGMDNVREGYNPITKRPLESWSDIYDPPQYMIHEDEK